MRPTSQCFLQNGPDGYVSVYLAAEAESAQSVWEDGPERYLASLTVEFVRKLGLGIARDTSTGGPGHAVLIGRKTKGMLSQMAKTAKWVSPYTP